MTIPFELNTTHCMDCLEALKLLPDKCVDLVLTDPPYGLAEKWQGGTWFQRGVYQGAVEWDIAISQDIIDLAIRKGVNAIVWGGHYYIMQPSRCWISWSKSNSVPTMADFELAWTNIDAPSKEFRFPCNGYERQHPTQKPVALFRWILEKYTKPNALILDPFMGSGTTGVAAIQTGRRFLGFEISPEYCKLANDRCEAAKRGLTLTEHRNGQQGLFE